MGLVQEFEGKAARTGRGSLLKDAQRYAEELALVLKHPEPTTHTKEDEMVEEQKSGE